MPKVRSATDEVPKGMSPEVWAKNKPPAESPEHAILRKAIKPLTDAFDRKLETKKPTKKMLARLKRLNAKRPGVRMSPADRKMLERARKDFPDVVDKLLNLKR